MTHKLGTMNFEVCWRKSVFGRTIKRRILKMSRLVLPVEREAVLRPLR